MKITNIETLGCDAGWRNYNFIKVSTDVGVVGWSEYSEGFGSPGVSAAIERLAPLMIGRNYEGPQRFYVELLAKIRPAASGIAGEAVGALENALLDAYAKHLNVPCCDLLGGRLRDRLRVYWSHCPAWRINHSAHYGPAITDLDGVKAMAEEVREKGFTGLKANLLMFDEGRPFPWAAGFGSPYHPELNIERRHVRNLRAMLTALRDGAGDDMDILLDLNFNAKPEGYLKLLRGIEDFDLFWVEIDSYDPASLAYVRSRSPHPISSCETLFGSAQFLPFLNQQAVDVAIVDAVWNGAWQSAKIAHVCDIHEVNVAPHNFYGHLSTMISAHFAASVPNFRIMETDIDRIAWDHELFTHLPEFVGGHLIVPNRPGWGTEPIEAALRKWPPRNHGMPGPQKR